MPLIALSVWLMRFAAVLAAAGLLLPSAPVRAQPAADNAAAAAQIADFFSSVGDKIFVECIYELSEEQIAVQQALIKAYVSKGASEAAARQIAARQIEPPKLSDKCERLRRTPAAATSAWDAKAVLPKDAKEGAPKEAKAVLPKRVKPEPAPATASPAAPPPPEPRSLVGRAPLEQWDCAAGIDFVTIRHNGYDRKLTGGEICNPFEDVVHEVPDVVRSFRLGYVIRTGRLFVISDVAAISGKTITWGLSGRDVCRNNPDPDCLATRAVGPLPPGEYTFANDKAHRVTWGPKTRRQVAAIYLSKLWNRERFSPRHTSAILARGNIAIHVRLKGEMSEACIGLEPKSWSYIAGLIKDGRATGLNVYIDEPNPQVAEKPPIVTRSTFSLSSLWK